MHGRLLAILLTLTLVAGCSSAPAESGKPRNDTFSPPTAGPTGFIIDGPRITPLDNRSRPLHEDDGARVTWALMGNATSDATFFVTFLLDGEVQEVESVRLAKGQTRAYERTLPDLWTTDRLHVEVRAGASNGTASADVTPWPRAGEPLVMGPLTVRVDRWLRNATDGVDAEATIERASAGQVDEVHAAVLCHDAQGNITKAGYVPVALPAAGTRASLVMNLPGCPFALYGVQLGGAPEVYGRILFEQVGWVPPHVRDR